MTLIKQVYQKNMSFFIIGTLKMLDLNLNFCFGFKFVISVIMMF